MSIINVTSFFIGTAVGISGK